MADPAPAAGPAQATGPDGPGENGRLPTASAPPTLVDPKAVPGSTDAGSASSGEAGEGGQSPRRRGRRAAAAAEAAPDWYKDAVIYELHVRSFHDAAGDGVGDFAGLTAKLDHLQELGVTALWLLPFYPSPLRDDGYDIADYRGVHPAYGTLADFKVFLRAAHARGLRVITELVLNHTSDAHPWFQRARRAPAGSADRDFYVWSDTPDKYSAARIIFKDFESSNWSWDPLAKAYYWHRFYSHQPDLNFDNPRVGQELFKVIDFWLGLGVDGLRLDAVPYLFERDGTICENLPETHEFLKRLRHHVDKKFPGRMLLAEANQWPEDAVSYFGQGTGDECHTAFHFPLMPRLFMAIRTENRFPILDILQQTPAIPETAQWVLFLRNHDELTLEMVTDEDRDYMYRVYANDPQARINLGIRRRLAPLLGNDRRRMELMNGLLFSLPGTPVLYYGDEIGMGDNVYLGDRNGVRTPMQWSSDRNAGFSRGKAQRLYLPPISDSEYHYEAVNVEAQRANPTSLLWWMQRLITLRRRHPAFGRGSLEFLEPDNGKVVCYLRSHGPETILVVANLSRLAQYVQLDLARWRGVRPVELMGGTEFPSVGEGPYTITLGPHQFHWFSLAQAAPEAMDVPSNLPVVRVRDGLEGLQEPRTWPDLAAAVPHYLRARRWFRGKSRRITGAQLRDVIPVPAGRGASRMALLLVAIDYSEGEGETYVLPVSEQPANGKPEPNALARLREPRGREGPETVLVEGMADPRMAQALLQALVNRRSLRGQAGELRALSGSFLRKALPRGKPSPEPLPLKAEQSNSSVRFGDQFMLKLLRVVAPGVHPDIEMGLFLTEKVPLPHVPDVGGWFEYHPEPTDAGPAPPLTIGVLQAFVPNQGDAWQFTQDFLSRYFERCLARPDVPPPSEPGDVARAQAPDAELAKETMSVYLEAARQLGERTAELHVALAGDRSDPAFAPEAITPMHQRSLYESQRAYALDVLRLLRSRLPSLSPPEQELAQAVLQRRNDLLARYQAAMKRPAQGLRIRQHGDYHLGQVLYTGNDFVIIDFEGEPARPLGERRLKRPPLRDVAGLLRSFHYASHWALQDMRSATAEARPRLTAWGAFWADAASASFLRAYLAIAQPAGLVPADARDAQLQLDAFVLDKGLYEVAYEINNRPDRVRVPLASLLALLGVPK